jgi:hypothetical protein
MIYQFDFYEPYSAVVCPMEQYAPVKRTSGSNFDPKYLNTQRTLGLDAKVRNALMLKNIQKYVKYLYNALTEVLTISFNVC